MYVEYTGLMWENAEQFNAIMVFAEHRYFGDSLPYSIEQIFGISEDTSDSSNMEINNEYMYYLTTNQVCSFVLCDLFVCFFFLSFFCLCLLVFLCVCASFIMHVLFCDFL